MIRSSGSAEAPCCKTFIHPHPPKCFSSPHQPQLSYSLNFYLLFLKANHPADLKKPVVSKKKLPRKERQNEDPNPHAVPLKCDFLTIHTVEKGHFHLVIKKSHGRPSCMWSLTSKEAFTSSLQLTNLLKYFVITVSTTKGTKEYMRKMKKYICTSGIRSIFHLSSAFKRLPLPC